MARAPPASSTSPARPAETAAAKSIPFTTPRCDRSPAHENARLPTAHALYGRALLALGEQADAERAFHEELDVNVNDWGTSITDPEDYVGRLAAFGLFTSDGGALRPVPLDQLDHIVAAVRAAQSRLYRAIAAMSRDEKIACGAYVYFGFLRPFAEVAGIADELDWTVPRDIPGPLYDLLAQFEGGQAEDVPEAEYYARFPEEATR